MEKGRLAAGSVLTLLALRADFHLPVDVGDLMRFDSCVLYTKHDVGVPELHVQVTARLTGRGGGRG
jgi:acyl-CoA hydrolase